MGYSHTFYAVDLSRLGALHGSGDETFADEIFAAKAEEIEDNDAFFEDAIDEEGAPDTKQAIRDILAGSIRKEKDLAAMYGYTLGILCDHLGEHADTDDVYCVRDHPFRSKLVASGPPLPIPVDPGDFPEIGFVEFEDLAQEIERLDAAPRKPKRSLRMALLSKLTGGIIGKQMDEDELAEDMAAYRAALVFCQERGRGIVSLRH